MFKKNINEILQINNLYCAFLYCINDIKLLFIFYTNLNEKSILILLYVQLHLKNIFVKQELKHHITIIL